jgi:anti-anti-sigma factor
MENRQVQERPVQRGGPGVEVVWPRPDTARVVLLGEHDLASTALLEEKIDYAFALASQLIVDVAEAEFIDSSTINVLLRAQRRADEEDVRFNLLLGTAPLVRRALEVASVLETLNAVDSLEAALMGD